MKPAGTVLLIALQRVVEQVVVVMLAMPFKEVNVTVVIVVVSAMQLKRVEAMVVIKMIFSST